MGDNNGDKSDLVGRARNIMKCGKKKRGNSFNFYSILQYAKFFICWPLAVEHFPVDRQRIERNLKRLDTNPEMAEQMLNIPLVKQKMLAAEKAIHDDKSKRENIRKTNDAVKKSMGLK